MARVAPIAPIVEETPADKLLATSERPLAETGELATARPDLSRFVVRDERHGLRPDDPGYYDGLVEMLLSDDLRDRREAVRTLSRVKPSDVPSKETRTRIARAFKTLAFEGQSFAKRNDLSQGQEATRPFHYKSAKQGQHWQSQWHSRSHPQWHLAYGLDYEQPEVRSHHLKLVREVCSRYDIDGLELDFERFWGYYMGMTAGHLADIADAVKMLGPVEDIVLDGTIQPGYTCATDSVNLLARKRGDVQVLLVSDYSPRPRGVIVTVPGKAEIEGTDLFTDRVVARLDTRNHSFSVTLRRDFAARLFRLQPAKQR